MKRSYLLILCVLAVMLALSLTSCGTLSSKPQPKEEPPVEEVVVAQSGYTITYVLNGGSWPADTDVPGDYETEEENLTVPSPVRDNYDFLGWRIKDSGDRPVKNYVITLTTDHDVSLEAVWGAHTYGIRLHTAGGKLDGKSMTYTILDQPFELPVPTRENYDFAGWVAEGSDAEPLQAYVVDTTAGGELEFTAVWTPTVYNIEYELAGGYYTYDVTNPTTYTVESSTFRLANPQKDNYVFLGWIRSGDKSLELQKNYTVRKGSSGDLKLYAVFQWKDVEVGDVTEMQQMIPEWGKNNIPRPNWVVKVPETDEFHYEKGYAKSGSFYDSLLLATKQALLAVAEWSGASAKATYSDADGVSANERNVEAEAAVMGREIVEYWEDAQGGVWVLVSVPNIYGYESSDSYDSYDWSSEDWSSDDWSWDGESGDEDFDFLQLLQLLFSSEEE
jgi:uncharacterized repeat protein (TIGR02543 family)